MALEGMNGGSKEQVCPEAVGASSAVPGEGQHSGRAHGRVRAEALPSGAIAVTISEN